MDEQTKRQMLDLQRILFTTRDPGTYRKAQAQLDRLRRREAGKAARADRRAEARGPRRPR